MKLDILFHYEINEHTGEITYIGKEEISIDTSKPIKVDSVDKEPKLYLEDNKCKLNSTAIILMGINPGDKLDIKYDSNKPVIGTDEAFGTKGGTKFNKSGTFSYRGLKNEELSKYGKEFIVSPHPSKNGLFLLASEELVQLKGDENVTIDTPEGIDIDLEGLVDDKDANVNEIDSNFFKL